MTRLITSLFACVFILASCSKDEKTVVICQSYQNLDQSRGPCNEDLNEVSKYTETINGNIRTITANSIPKHLVGAFGPGMNSLSPNRISEQNEVYEVTTEPVLANETTQLLSTTGIGPEAGPQYSFGILYNGVELDPVAAEPWPHLGMNHPDVNWEWNLEASNVRIGLDCNNAHVQPNGKYHYHGPPVLYLEDLKVDSVEMTMIGFAADGFPIYYKYGFLESNNLQSDVIELSSSYKLKSGNRPGDGITAPCDEYNGVYSNDYEYVSGWGILDECNGRTGVTPEYPGGTYYYIITDDYPFIPRCFKGSPSMDFKIGL